MQARILMKGKPIEVLLDQGHDLSIPLFFERGKQPNAFSLPPALAVAARVGGFVGSTVEGGSCNCSTITLTPHGNGTHTEGIGHLTDEPFGISEIFHEVLVPAWLVTLTPEQHDQNTTVITKNLLKEKLNKAEPDFLEALVVKTRPNDISKKHRNYSGSHPPYFTETAIAFLNARGVRHLLVDLPSLDREDDPTLIAHRTFWHLPRQGHHQPGNEISKTVTEMIYVPDAVPDGPYFLNLQIPPFALDAAPSRPILFPIRET